MPLEDIALLGRIRIIFSILPDLNLVDEKGRATEVSCHLLVRAFAATFNIRYKDGYFGNICDHSWLITPKGNIIDLYPVGIVGCPFLIETKNINPWIRMYKEAVLLKLVGDSFQSNVLRVTQEVCKAVKVSGIEI